MRARPAHISISLLALAAIASLAVSCARDLPTAAPRSVETRAGARHLTGQDISQEIVVTLAPGAHAVDVASTYGAVLLLADDQRRVAVLHAGPADDATDLRTRLASDPRITTTESNRYLQPAESRQKSFAFDDGLGTPQTYNAQPAAESMHLGAAHLTSLGDGVRVAILDTGIDATHPYLAGRVVAQHDFIDDDADASEHPLGLDTNGDGEIDEAFGHGTHIAGIVGLTAPAAQLVVGRVLDSDGIGDVVTVAQGIRWAVSQGAQVINLSLGALEESDAIEDAIEDAQQAGVVVVAAVGNWGSETPREFPASMPGVAAIAACDAYGVPAEWTSYEPYVALSAPGVAIRSTYPGGGYRLWSGTSMSVPFVAGTAALLRQVHPDWSAWQVMIRIRGSVAPLQYVPATAVGKLGSGMLDVGAALAPDAVANEDDGGGDVTPVRH